MRKPILALAGLALAIGPIHSRDALFTFKGTHHETAFLIEGLSADQCSKFLLTPFVELPSTGEMRTIVASAEIENGGCHPATAVELPDYVYNFVDLPPIKFYEKTVQVGDGRKLERSVAADFISWEDDKYSYYMTDDLTVIHKATGVVKIYHDRKE